MKETGSIILRNSIVTPDGTTLVSRHRHDYKEHVDANGNTYAVDGGSAYLRRVGPENGPQAEDTSVVFLAKDTFQTIRFLLEWGSYGKDGNEPLHYIRLGDMETEHIEAILRTQQLSNFHRGAFLMELALRETA